MTGTSVALDAMAPLVERWRAAKCSAARLAATVAAAERVIADALGDADTGTINGHIVVSREAVTRQGFRIAEFQAQHPDLADQFITRRRRESLKIPHDRPEADAS
jgi:hypothetical protein